MRFDDVQQTVRIGIHNDLRVAYSYMTVDERWAQPSRRRISVGQRRDNMIHEPHLSRRRFLTAAAGAGLIAGLPGRRLRSEEPLQLTGIIERLRKEIEEAPLALRFNGS